MSELDAIIAKYEKLFKGGTSDVEQEIKRIMPSIVESFIEFYGEDKRQEIEDKFRRIHFMIPPTYLPSLYHSFENKVLEYLKKKYPLEKLIDYDFSSRSDEIGWYTTNNELIEEIKEIRGKLEPFKNLVDSYSNLMNSINDKLIEEKSDTVIQEINTILKQDVGYSDEMISKFKYNLNDDSSITAVVDVVKDRKKILESNYFVSVMNYIQSLRDVGIDIPKVSIEKKYDSYLTIEASKEEMEESLQEAKEFLFSESVTKYLPNEETVKKIMEIYNKAQYEIVFEAEWKTMQQIYDVKELSNDFLGERRYEPNFSNFGGQCAPILRQQGDNVELWNVLSINPYYMEDKFLGDVFIHECNHALESACNYTNYGSYILSAGWDAYKELNIETNQLTSYVNNPFRPYELINEVINDFITRDVWNITKQKASSNLLEDRHKEGYYNAYFVLEEFYQIYKSEIIQSRQSGDMNVLFEKVGKENMDNLIQLMTEASGWVYNQGFKYDKAVEKSKNGVVDGETKFLESAIAERNRILGNMQEYSQAAHRSRGIVNIYSLMIIIIVVISIIFIFYK